MNGLWVVTASMSPRPSRARREGGERCRHGRLRHPRRLDPGEPGAQQSRPALAGAVDPGDDRAGRPVGGVGLRAVRDHAVRSEGGERGQRLRTRVVDARVGVHEQRLPAARHGGGNHELAAAWHGRRRAPGGTARGAAGSPRRSRRASCRLRRQPPRPWRPSTRPPTGPGGSCPVPSPRPAAPPRAHRAADRRDAGRCSSGRR